MIKLQNLTVTLHQGQVNEIEIIKDLSISFSASSFNVIVGANGSGKSTLLNTIAGSISNTSGTVFFEDEDVTKLPDYKRSKWIARVFQNPLQGTAPDLSIIENCRLAALRTQKKGFKIGINANFINKVKEQIATLNMGLENKLDTLVGSLSGGQRQALTLIMSVLDNCKILLLDEPTAALDPKTANTIMQITNLLIKEHKLTALMVTHNLKDANNYGNRIIQLQEGKVVKDFKNSEKEALNSETIFSWF